MHALVASSLVAGPPARDYEGSLEVAAPEGAIVPVAPGGPSGPAPTVAEPAPSEPVVTEPPPPKPAPIVAGDPLLPAAEDSTVAEGPDDEVDALPYDPLVDSPEAIRARGWVRSGAIFTVIGGVLTIGGIAMRAAKVNTVEMQDVCDPRQDPAGNGCQETGRNRAAAALAIPGALLLAGGIAMIAVGKVQQRRLRADLRASRRELLIGLQFAF